MKTNKKIILIVVAVILILSTTLYMTTTMVKTGIKIVCPECKKVIADETKSKLVLKKDASHFSVEKIEKLCSNCKIEVQTGTRTVCSECSKVISDETRKIEVAKREANRYSVQEIKSICDSCQIAQFQDPDKVAKNFFQALRERNMEKAMQYCDSSVYDDSVGEKFGTVFGGPTPPYLFCSVLASKIDNQWIISEVSYIDGETGFIIGDKKQNRVPISNAFYIITGYKKVKAAGWLICLHQIEERWLIYKIKGYETAYYIK